MGVYNLFTLLYFSYEIHGLRFKGEKQAYNVMNENEKQQGKTQHNTLTTQHRKLKI